MQNTYDALSELEWEQVDRILEMLDEGEFDSARMQLSGMFKKRPGHPDLRILDATIALEEAEPMKALAALKGAERSADPAHFFYLRATAHYDLVHFAEAKADAERAIAIHPGYAHAFDLVSRICEHVGDNESAAKAALEATTLDPEGFPLPLDVPQEEFDRVVEASLKELPKPIREKLKEIPVIVQPLPDPEILAEEDPPLTPDLLGLFVGRHLMERSVNEAPVAPGAIYLFRRNLLRACTDREELAKEIRITVQHEVGHLLGLDEDDLDQWGLA